MFYENADIVNVIALRPSTGQNPAVLKYLLWNVAFITNNVVLMVDFFKERIRPLFHYCREKIMNHRCECTTKRLK